MTLRQQLLRMAKALVDLADSLEEPAQSVSYAQFQRLLHAKYPHSKTGHGAKRAFLDYNQAEFVAGKTHMRITEAVEQTWRRDGVVPNWAYDYLLAIPVLPARPPRTYWSEAEISYLADLIRRYPNQSYDQMAVRCSRRFRRVVSVCAIKGTTDRWGIGKKAA